MEEKLKYKIPEPKRTVNKRTGQKGYKIYNYTWYENGKRRVSDTKWYLTKQECKAEAENKIKGCADIVYIQSKLKMKELIEEYKLYIRDVDIDEVAPATKKNRYDVCNALLRYTSAKILDTKLMNLDVDTLREWLNVLRTSKSKRFGKTLGREYVDGLKNMISLILRYAEGKNYFQNSLDRYTTLLNYLYNDTRTAKVKKTKKEFRYMTYAEFKKFATCCLYDYDLSDPDLEEEDKKELEEKIDKAIMKTFNPNSEINFDLCKHKNIIYFYFFVCMFFLGTRTEEGRILGWSDFNFDAGKHEGRVYVSKAYTSYYFKSDTEAYLYKMRTKNAGSIRRIPIHPMLKHLIMQYRSYLFKKDIRRDELFPGPDSGFISYAQINHKIERTLYKAGMQNKKFTKHDFRRSCAMYLCYELKLPKDQAISFFGWTSTEMLDEVYARFDEIQKADRLEENLDEVGFFDKVVPIMEYYPNTNEVRYNLDVKENGEPIKEDEYHRVYHKHGERQKYKRKPEEEK